MAPQDFRNRVRSLYNIDKWVLDEALVAAKHEPMTSSQWQAFVSDPPRFLIRTDDDMAAVICACVEARQKPDMRLAELEDLLDRCLTFADKYVDVVDGDYGQPEPNEAMRLTSAIREAIPELATTGAPND